jgi:hypothetical protein
VKLSVGINAKQDHRATPVGNGGSLRMKQKEAITYRAPPQAAAAPAEPKVFLRSGKHLSQR